MTHPPGDDHTLSRRCLLTTGLATGGVAAFGVARHVAGGGGSLFDDSVPTGVGRSPERLSRPPRRRWRESTIGWSHEGRPIRIHQNVAPGGRASVLVIAAVHGDERGTAPVANELVTMAVPEGIDAHVVPIANPDGWVRGTRNNALDVDLNRNFPYLWQWLGGGPAAGSEPETQALMALVERIRATVTVWIHEPYEYVAHLTDQSRPYAEAWGRGAELPTKRVQQHGGGETWTAHAAGLPSVLVEGVSRDLSLDDLQRHRRGFEELVAIL